VQAEGETSFVLGSARRRTQHGTEGDSPWTGAAFDPPAPQAARSSPARLAWGRSG